MTLFFCNVYLFCAWAVGLVIGLLFEFTLNVCLGEVYTACRAPHQVKSIMNILVRLCGTIGSMKRHKLTVTSRLLLKFVLL